MTRLLVNLFLSKWSISMENNHNLPFEQDTFLYQFYLIRERVKASAFPNPGATAFV